MPGEVQTGYQEKFLHGKTYEGLERLLRELAESASLEILQTLHLGMWFSDDLGSARLMVQLSDPKGLLQPK